MPAAAPLLDAADVLPASAPWVGALDEALTTLLADAARGPKREGLFALWLVVRAAADAAEQFAVAPPIWQQRHEALAQRLSSVALAAPLRRALTTAMSTLRAPTAANGALVLSQLAAPVRDVLGDAPARAIEAAAAAARTAVQSAAAPGASSAAASRTAARRTPAALDSSTSRAR